MITKIYAHHRSGEAALYYTDTGELCDYNLCVPMSESEADAAAATLIAQWVRDGDYEEEDENRERR